MNQAVLCWSNFTGVHNSATSSSQKTDRQGVSITLLNGDPDVSACLIDVSETDVNGPFTLVFNIPWQRLHYNNERGEVSAVEDPPNFGNKNPMADENVCQ